MSAIDPDQSQDMSTTDASILNVLTKADGAKYNFSKPTGKAIDDSLSIHMFLEDLRFLSKH